MSVVAAPHSHRAPLAALATLWPFLRPYRRSIALAFGFLLLAAGATLALPRAVGQMIDHGFSPADAAFIDRYFLALIALAAVLATAAALRFYFVTRIGEQVIADLRCALFEHLLRQETEFFDSTPTGALLSRLGTDTELIQTVIGSSASVAARNLLMLCGALVMLFITSPKLSLLIVLGIPLVVAPILLFGQRVQRLSRQSQERLAEGAGIAGEVFGAIETVQAYAREPEEAQRYGAAVLATLATARRRIAARALLTAVVILLVFGAVTVVLWVGAKAVLAGTMSGGELSQFVLYAVIAAGATGAISEVWGDVQRAAGASERIAEWLSRRPQITDPPHSPTLPLRLEARVQFEAVEFRYPSRPDVAALRDIDLDIRPGSTVAVVGRSGAGKSTLFKLLLRFHDPSRGRIRIGGYDLSSLPLGYLREQLALVPQDPVIFAASAYDNIRYGRPRASRTEVLAAARAAEAEEFIGALPQGYDTLLGERGMRLSGGQRQRIAIARALLKDAPILLLDEATSALDAESERAVQAALERLMQGRTTLVIAHRLATVRRADRIVVLDRGRIVAQGRHEELLAADGIYAELARLQFEV